MFVALLAWALLPATVSRESPVRSRCKSNLKRLGLAMYNYHERYNCFPPAYVADDHGRPMHSWRVLLLPFLNEGRLYEQYHFDEPWDGPNNRRLADTAMPVFHCPSDEHSGSTSPPTMTSYVAVVGAETIWPDSRSAAIRDITDGTASTIAIVEISNSGIHWMEPRDLHIAQMAPIINPKSGQGFSSRHSGGAHALLCDGSAVFFSEKISAESMRAWLTAYASDHHGDF
jgi:prepilin-type processing-associated H-X9-DG protein